MQERTVNELGVLTSESRASFERMVIGYLNLMRTNGAFEDKVFDEYTTQDGNGYMLSNDRNRWLPGRQSGRNTPRFIAEHIGSGRASFEFDSPASNKYVDWIQSFHSSQKSGIYAYLCILHQFGRYTPILCTNVSPGLSFARILL